MTGYATAPELLGRWTKYAGNPVMSLVKCPHVYLVDGTYHAFYSTGTYALIAHATSADGITWGEGTTILSPGAEGQWDHDQVAHSHTLCVDGTWYLYYDGWPSGTPQRIGAATASAIGGPYTKYESNPLISRGAYGSAQAFVMPWEDGYRMWFHGSLTGQPGQVIFLYDASDPLGPFSVLRVPELVGATYDEGVGVSGSQVSDPRVVDDGKQWVLLYTADRNWDAEVAPSYIKAATSPYWGI